MQALVVKKRRLSVIVAICLAVVPWHAYAATENPAEKPAEALYLQLRQVRLDPARVYRVRGASLDRSAVHISLEDGTIAFTQDVMGRITGAFFEGDGEVLLTPPSSVERNSMSLFTGMAILEEHFATAYFRFNYDAASELQPGLRAADNQQEFIERWGAAAENLANADAMRLLFTFSRMLPASGTTSAERRGPAVAEAEDRFLHARLQGTKLGVFDVYFDSEAAEQLQAGQLKTADHGDQYYDVWTSFSPLNLATVQTRTTQTRATQTRNAPGRHDEVPASVGQQAHESGVVVRRYVITTEVRPPEIHARAQLQCDVKEGGARSLLFELSRYLQIESVKVDGRAVEFIHNPAVEGTQLSRQGNDLVAVILSEPARAGQTFDLEFVYGGEVLEEAGDGLLYVGARGTWYPNRGMAMADFDLEFTYPQGWTLVATGKPTPVSTGPASTTLASSAPISPAVTAAKASGQQTSHWVSERPIPLAGFNLGKYKEATAQAGNVSVETYATSGVERNFPAAAVQVVEPPSGASSGRRQLVVPNRPSPAQNEVTVAEVAARAIQYYAERFGPYPYSHLALTQIPGRDSQGWPGLVFLSSYAFLSQQEREELHYEPYKILLQESLPAHETAHQWWGDLISWSSYRDQWFSEGLANYCSLMMLQEKNPMGFRQIMEAYRRDLVEKNKDGVSAIEAGPVTLGPRLQSSRFPKGYDEILYGRGTWLFHMLRTMLDDAALQAGGRKGQSSSGPDEPFVRALRKVRQRYEGKAINTQELLDVFAEDLPPALRYEGKSSLDWFLDGWVNGTALPKLELKSVKFTAKSAGSAGGTGASGTVVSGTILQKDVPADLVTSVPVYAVTVGRQPVLLGRVFADGEDSSFRLAAPAGTSKVVLDPNQTILTSPR
jgi:hypothetical protein